ncbi:hypothetical protein Scep_027897 [Stephania cephalantha]|uniref:Uncharacterized protein n=1 Tax=Stephania cephalantha TaxID=152367 RepID=A0AAP0HMY9_9MAGN
MFYLQLLIMHILEEIYELQREWFIPFLETLSETSCEEIIEPTLLHDCIIIEEAEREVEHIQERSDEPYEQKKGRSISSVDESTSYFTHSRGI